MLGQLGVRICGAKYHVPAGLPCHLPCAQVRRARAPADAAREGVCFLSVLNFGFQC